MKRLVLFMVVLTYLIFGDNRGFCQTPSANLRQQHEQEIARLKQAADAQEQQIRRLEAQLAARGTPSAGARECEELLQKATTKITDLEKSLSITEANLDSTTRASEVVLRIEQEKCNVRLTALNEKLVLQQVYSDSILALEQKKYEDVKKILLDAARRRWYESPQLLLGLGFLGGFLLAK